MEAENINNDRKLFMAIYDVIVGACTGDDDDKYLQVSSIHMRLPSLRKEILNLNEFTYTDIVNRIKNTKTHIRHWDVYIITVALDVIRHQILDEINMGNHLSSL